MKLTGLEETIDGLVEEVVKILKNEIKDKKDIKIAIKHPDIQKRYKLDRTILEPIFLISENQMEAFTIFWDDFELFKFPYIDLDFYIKSKMMQWAGPFLWYPIWFKSLPAIDTQYTTNFFKKIENDLIEKENNET